MRSWVVVVDWYGASSMGFKLARRDDCERAGNWQLVRRTLDLRSFGINVVRSRRGADSRARRDRPRPGGTVLRPRRLARRSSSTASSIPRRAGTFARLDPEALAHGPNSGEERASALIVSAPRSSGYEPMDWA